VFDVTITSSGVLNRRNTTIDYVIGSDVSLTCTITPAPPPNSEIRWNCSTGCFDGLEMGNSINLMNIQVREGGMIYCSVTIAETVYYSELSDIKIIGKILIWYILESVENFILGREGRRDKGEGETDGGD